MMVRNQSEVPSKKKEVETPIQSGTELETTSGREQNTNQNKIKYTGTGYNSNVALLNINTGEILSGCISDIFYHERSKSINSWNNLVSIRLKDIEEGKTSKSFYKEEELVNITSRSYDKMNYSQRNYITKKTQSNICSFFKTMYAKEEKDESRMMTLTTHEKMRGGYYYPIMTFEEALMKLPSKMRCVWPGLARSYRCAIILDIDKCTGITKKERKQFIKNLTRELRRRGYPEPNVILINTRLKTDKEGNILPDEDQYHCQIQWYLNDPYIDLFWNGKIYENFEDPENRREVKDTTKATYLSIIHNLAKANIDLGADPRYTGGWIKNPFADDIELYRFREVGDTVSRSEFENIFKEEIKKDLQNKGFILNTLDYSVEEDEELENSYVEEFKEKDLRDIKKISNIKKYPKAEDTITGNFSDDSIINYYINKYYNESCVEGLVSRTLMTVYTSPSIIFSKTKKKEDLTKEFVSDIVRQVASIAAKIKGTEEQSEVEINGHIDAVYTFVTDQYNPLYKSNFGEALWTEEDREESKYKRNLNLSINALEVLSTQKLLDRTSSKVVKDFTKKTDSDEGYSVNTVKAYLRKNPHKLYRFLKGALIKEKKKLSYLKDHYKGHARAEEDRQNALIKKIQMAIALYEAAYLNKMSNTSKALIREFFEGKTDLDTMKEMNKNYFCVWNRSELSNYSIICYRELYKYQEDIHIKQIAA